MSQTLNLASAPAVLFLFGLAGAGKSYVGDLIGELAGWHVYHADDDLTEEMILALKEQRPFTEQMRDDYFPIVVEKVLALRRKHPRIVITQGVYKQRHRDYLTANIPDLEMICVDASDASILLRLNARGKGISNESAKALRLDFERPAEGCKVITNSTGAADIIRQLNRYYSKPTDLS